jgi:hypothetical protein
MRKKKRTAERERERERERLSFISAGCLSSYYILIAPSRSLAIQTGKFDILASYEY